MGATVHTSMTARDVVAVPKMLPTATAARPDTKAVALQAGLDVPDYLSRHYWWAYVHPNAVRLFERGWLVNLILWGNYARLRNAALAELGEHLPGRTLQVACVYGDLTCRLSDKIAAAGGTLDVVDVLPIQLKNLRRKLPPHAPARLLVMNSGSMRLADASYDRALVFFLLHEQPRNLRERTLSEVLRVVKPGGRVVILDYALPRWWHPLRYLWRPLLAGLEPFALDLWRQDIAAWLPPVAGRNMRRDSFFGGLYQKLVVTR
ncbi:MAG TPA: rhodoquinone biosynthesis methyltransferase RquA [Xanthobacteraceae bacterium]|nr:rhodoquinone biosynthesis methyltransferase RquA [Xanthobacteraceae bacterium]